MDFANAVRDPCVIQDPLRKRRLSCVNMGHNANIARMLKVSAHDVYLSQLRGHHNHTPRGKEFSWAVDQEVVSTLTSWQGA
jgi:hypothetical protein